MSSERDLLINGSVTNNREAEVLLVKDIIKEFPLKVEEYKNGKVGIVSMFMGEAMRRSGGNIDPQRTNNLIVEFLDNHV